MISATQIVTLILGITIAILAFMWKRKEEFDSIFPVLFLIGLHTSSFYSLLWIFRALGYDTATNLYPVEWFPFETWSPVLRLHTLASIIIIMVLRNVQQTQREKIKKETLKILRENGHGR